MWFTPFIYYWNYGSCNSALFSVANVAHSNKHLDLVWEMIDMAPHSQHADAWMQKYAEIFVRINRRVSYGTFNWMKIKTPYLELSVPRL